MQGKEAWQEVHLTEAGSAAGRRRRRGRGAAAGAIHQEQVLHIAGNNSGATTADTKLYLQGLPLHRLQRSFV